MAELERANEILAESVAWDSHGCITLKPGDTRMLPQLVRYRDASTSLR
jgi:hypothetical protein